MTFCQILPILRNYKLTKNVKKRAGISADSSQGKYFFFYFT